MAIGPVSRAAGSVDNNGPGLMLRQRACRCFLPMRQRALAKDALEALSRSGRSQPAVGIIWVWAIGSCRCWRADGGTDYRAYRDTSGDATPTCSAIVAPPLTLTLRLTLFPLTLTLPRLTVLPPPRLTLAVLKFPLFPATAPVRLPAPAPDQLPPPRLAAPPLLAVSGPQTVQCSPKSCKSCIIRA
jgi:hypothetical protein